MSRRGGRRRFRGQRRRFVEKIGLGEHGALPLSSAIPGHPMRILYIVGDRRAKQHLEAMGFTPGEMVTVWATQDPLVALIRGSKVALSRRLAEHIKVGNS